MVAYHTKAAMGIELTYLSIVSPDVQPPCGRVVFLHDLDARHEAGDAHVVVAVLQHKHGMKSKVKFVLFNDATGTH